MIIICIDNDQLESRSMFASKISDRLTLGKQYQVIDFSKFHGYVIEGDDGIVDSFRADRFIRLDEQREQKLKDLGI